MDRGGSFQDVGMRPTLGPVLAALLPLFALTMHCGSAVTGESSSTSGATPIPRPTAACAGASTSPVTLASGSFMTGLATDGTMVYWADQTGAVHAVPVAGGTAKLLGTEDGYNDFPQVGVDDTYVYVAGGPDVDRIDKATGELVVLASQEQIGGLAIFGGSVFWTSSFEPGARSASTGSLQSVDATGTVKTLASDLGFPGELAVDESNAYWVDSLGSVSMVPLEGGKVKTPVSNQAGINGIAAAGGYVYWTNYSGQVGTCGLCPPAPPPKLGDGTLNRTSATDGTTTVLATSYAAGGVTVDASYAYWTDMRTITAVPVEGGTARLVANEAAWIGPVLDECYVYWIDTNDEVRRVAKPE
jgi:hypothetical protein